MAGAGQQIRGSPPASMPASTRRAAAEVKGLTARPSWGAKPARWIASLGAVASNAKEYCQSRLEMDGANRDCGCLIGTGIGGIHAAWRFES
jgi:hypothetical protein